RRVVVPSPAPSHKLVAAFVYSQSAAVRQQPSLAHLLTPAAHRVSVLPLIDPASSTGLRHQAEESIHLRAKDVHQKPGPVIEVLLEFHHPWWNIKRKDKP